MTVLRAVRPLVATAVAVALGGVSLAAQVRPANAAAPARAAADTAWLRRTLDSLVAGHHGVVGYAVHDLETGARIGARADEPFPTASLIKVPILVTLFGLVEHGSISLDDELTMLRIDKVPGSGQLQHLHDGLRITVRDAAWLMTTLSDNTATNLILDKVNILRVASAMDSLGLHRTRLHHKVFLRAISSVAPDSSLKYQLGVTTPNEMAGLFARLARGQAVNPRADSVMLDILAHNEDWTLLQRSLTGLVSPHKTGADDGMRTECALWTLPDRVVACVLTKQNVDLRWTFDNEAEVLMGRMGEAIVRAFRREGAH